MYNEKHMQHVDGYRKTILTCKSVINVNVDAVDDYRKTVPTCKSVINVNVDVYRMRLSRVQQTLQFTPFYWNSLIRSHLLWGEFTTFSAADAIHNSPMFRSTVYPLQLGGEKQYGMRSLPDTSTHD